MGSVEAVTNSLAALAAPDVDISIIHSSIGSISKSDVLFAETASRLIVGFQVGVMPAMDKVLREHRVEVRLYDVIYKLIDDIKAIAGDLVPHFPEERIIGSGKIIALFKSSRKGIIIGCDVQEGFIAVGERFRIISAMGPVYEGIIESLHIGDTAVQESRSRTAGRHKNKAFQQCEDRGPRREFSSSAGCKSPHMGTNRTDYPEDGKVRRFSPYRPCGNADIYPPLDRGISCDEYEEALRAVLEYGIARLDKRASRLRIICSKRTRTACIAVPYLLEAVFSQ